MKLKLGKLTARNYAHLQEYGWVQLPAESPAHKRKAKAGRVRAAQPDRGKLVGRLPKEKR